MKILNRNKTLLTLLFMLLFSQLSLAENHREKVDGFMKAMQQVYQPQATSKNIDDLFAFMTDDITDYHAAYGVTMVGKEKKRKGLQQKAIDSISYELTVENIIMGTDTAIIEFKEDANYIKNGKPKHFLGRTIMVFEFNEQGLIKHMRRYLD
jgi:ketosteroid isomerase-like protein